MYQRGMEDQAVVGDPQAAFEAEIGFVFGYPRPLCRWGPYEHVLGAKDPSLEVASDLTDWHRQSINDL
ncbi:MAG: hypothetical protein CME16_01250 [Gemmatimonadetes bacterium]|nr:hypothetical protein [Gemmatimonadota bacterium]